MTLLLRRKRHAGPPAEPDLLGQINAMYPEDFLAVYDPKSLTSMFQDRAGTSVTTDAEQYVGHILDVSGHGHSMSASADGKRPILQRDGLGEYYLEMGIVGPQCLRSDSNFDLSACSGVTVVMAYGAADPTGSGVALEFTQGSYTYNGSFTFWLPDYGNDAGWYVRGTTRQDVGVAVAGYPATHIIAATANLTTNTIKIYIDGVLGATKTADLAGPNFVSDILYWGQRADGGDYFKGRMYRMAILGAEADAAGLSLLNRYVNQTAHVTLAP